ncbi:hypothetical protein GMO_18490 [Gluconobacter morbifer G707]|uniref:Uncharacterized protein n=1 Tax=Gluconobacter morbifer G707 TaxID=1088869 RepID=G6XJH7_9PROT|nr:hypothetical protein GMO_18490 [Gluconobacter morbifer G707]
MVKPETLRDLRGCRLEQGWEYLHDGALPFPERFFNRPSP